MVEERLEQELADRDTPLLPRLDGTFDPPVIGAVRLARGIPRPRDVEPWRVGQELNVAPPQRERLSDPQAGEEQCPEQRPVRLAGRLDERGDLIELDERLRLLPDFQPANLIYRVAVDVAVPPRAPGGAGSASC